jgi:hypothetical protein
LPIEVTAMADSYNAYRDALVVEESTEWSTEFDALPPAERQRIAEALHAEPQAAQELEYIRTHTGFCRRIIVTPDDVKRLGH